MPLITTLEKIAPLSDKCKAALREVVKYKNCPKDRFLVTQGQISDKLYYIETGLARVFCDSDSDSDNRTITAWFGREGGFVCSVQSFFSQKPAIESIQLLENSKLWVISHADWEHMLAEFPELNLHFRKIYQYYLTIYDARIYLLREKNPKKQYESFLKFYPKLGNRVKIRYIAQYLNMHSVTLSNVRKSLIHNE